MMIPVIAAISIFFKFIPPADNNNHTSHIQTMTSMTIPMTLDVLIKVRIY